MSSLYYMTTRDTYTAEGDLLPIGEAARLLGVSIETIRRWDRAGRLPSTRTLGGQRRFARADVERARNGSAASVLTSGVCQQCGATTEECREGVAEERTCCEECDHYPVPDAEALGVEP